MIEVLYVGLHVTGSSIAMPPYAPLRIAAVADHRSVTVEQLHAPNTTRRAERASQGMPVGHVTKGSHLLAVLHVAAHIGLHAAFRALRLPQHDGLVRALYLRARHGAYL